MISANKGEWSELYVMFKLLGEKRLYDSDVNLNKLETFYPIVNIIRYELKRKKDYTIDGISNIVIITEKDKKEVIRVSTCEFLEEANKLLDKIKTGGNTMKGAFEIPEIEPFMRNINCEKIKAQSTEKADIYIILHDYHTNITSKFGFSIKSDLGNSPTLLNASQATKIRYQLVDGKMNDDTAKSINSKLGKTKLQERMKAIHDKGCRLQFSSIPNDIFRGNLQMIDSSMPEIIAWMLGNSYFEGKKNFKEALERINEVNPMHFDMQNGHKFYEYKIKSLMTAVALGMLPATPWSGYLEATGGYLIVKENGEVVCFHIYNRNVLEDYLINNTKFDTPDSKRYNMGKIYREGDRYYFDLVLQIRFK